MRSFATTPLAALLGVLAATAASSSAEARFGRVTNYEEGAAVEAMSRYGNGSQLGVVRSSRFGWEVRLPRGTWVGCRRSCEETLRVETVDRFETEDALTGYGSAAHECGVFGCLEIGLPY